MLESKQAHTNNLKIGKLQISSKASTSSQIIQLQKNHIHSKTKHPFFQQNDHKPELRGNENTT